MPDADAEPAPRSNSLQRLAGPRSTARLEGELQQTGPAAYALVVERFVARFDSYWALIGELA